MANKTALITGVTGQDGAYLAKRLMDEGYKVYGGVRRTSSGIHHRLNELGILNHIEFIDFDLTDQENISRMVSKYKPTHFYNLAAQSFVGSSWEYPAYTSMTNAMGPLYILEAIRNYSKETRFYQASTSEMFGLVQETPQKETTPFYPRSPYGVGKLYAHMMTRNYRESFDMFATAGILFNHESPLRGVEFVTRKITLEFARIKHGQKDMLHLGNMDAKRDWGYADEYVQGMIDILTADTPDEYVLATGKTEPVRKFVEIAAQAAGFDIEWNGEGEDEVGIDRKSGKQIVGINPTFYRPAEVDILIGDPSKAKEKLGWKAEVSVEKLAEMMFKADNDRVSNNRVLF